MRYIALLRGVNVGGRKKIGMERLRAVFEGMGFVAVRTYIQSGNVLFRAPEQDPAALRARVEKGLAAALGVPVEAVLLSREGLAAVLAANPFAGRPLAEHERVYIIFLREAPSAAAWAAFRPVEGGVDEFAPAGGAVWLLCRGGYGRTAYSNGFFERKLAVKATTRAIETAGKLVELSQEGE